MRYYKDLKRQSLLLLFFFPNFLSSLNHHITLSIVYSIKLSNDVSMNTQSNLIVTRFSLVSFLNYLTWHIPLKHTSSIKYCYHISPTQLSLLVAYGYMLVGATRVCACHIGRVIKGLRIGPRLLLTCKRYHGGWTCHTMYELM